MYFVDYQNQHLHKSNIKNLYIFSLKLCLFLVDFSKVQEAFHFFYKQKKEQNTASTCHIMFSVQRLHICPMKLF